MICSGCVGTTSCRSATVYTRTTKMNEYEKAAKAVGEDTLFPSLNPSDDVKHAIWSRRHQNRFWSRYLETSGNACPACGSTDYEVNERELYQVGQEKPASVRVWYSCNECGVRWENDYTEPNKKK
ncbi:hypothetical protein DNAM5_24 [Haloarcula californiae tailed virus 1]|uniref:TFIIS-type domain-containing protein n=1 Tax=Haloarcula californiae tailed virus 1 TaxID=1273746 RepID=R4TMF6_9CAUD|nr:hypothetical protein M202_gp024 [Haloarcula californiae tailed virus 1]AGM11887.1 hypothetical protein DNAM5_24 [Haloarcula californiae tailed virus 1]